MQPKQKSKKSTSIAYSVSMELLYKKFVGSKGTSRRDHQFAIRQQHLRNTMLAPLRSPKPFPASETARFYAYHLANGAQGHS